ncbi:ADP-ribosylglycohydrolase family protein [Polyangium sp. 15x6]|uniref:ADP-ribosylglycohydrolase family protein n=1 Tax=Polyangium sp. 15x6 TaxID=3042687 RepID=UPI00249B0EB8|nr:ADP-ribosylglycohydrolase family protein [Polyangium sp. 15x6]MDI3287331.1 ADP-ribosylglycohydrolase family protein [Polyangium sp. 15x6]
MSTREASPSEDLFLGCLLGGALGDALGYPIEFVRSEKQIIERFGATAPPDLSYASEVRVSDDTQMTLFSAEALLRARSAGSGAIVPFALGAYQRWYVTQEMAPRDRVRHRSGEGLLLADPRLYARRAPGQTCLSALSSSFTRPSIATIDDPPNGSKGCGAVMRAAPFGLAARTREDAFVAARDAAVLTHGHPSGYLSAAYLAALVHDIAQGATLEEAMGLVDALLIREREHQEVAAALARARALAAGGALSPSAIEQLGGGWVGEEALAIAIACALQATARDVAQTLWRAVAHGGDSDSTGSITGNLVGVMFGASALPMQWLSQLELRDLIERVARDLHAAAMGRGCPDPTDYPAADGVVRVPRWNA